MLKKFIKADKYAAKNMITCGFELETQETNGMTAADCCDDIDHLMFDIENDPHEFVYYLDGILGDICQSVGESVLAQALRGRNLYDVCSASDSDYYHVVDLIRDRIVEDRNSMADLEYDLNDSNVEIGEDGTVSGFEFRTRGGRTYDQFLKSCTRVFKMDHYIDTECSFHIHLAVKECGHAYRSSIQSAAMQYILDHSHQLPMSVIARFENHSNMSDYARFKVENEKYTAVSFCDRLGTWEFRCFGNVQNAREAKTCLDMAISALQYGYAMAIAGVELPVAA